MKKALRIFLRCIGAALLALAGLVVLSEASPIYDFPAPEPFSGSDLFDPYASFDPAIGWKRANFHTHTKVDGIFNECPEWPDKVYADYMKFGYDILAFSNHNELTVHPVDSSLQIDVYEHGFNPLKFHKLVFNPSRMILHDIVIPFLPSQRQFEMDYLGRNADFLVLNHPDRTGCTTAEMMRLVSGYRLIEADCGAGTDGRRWDEALSAGHYSFCLADDDCHDSGCSSRIAVRCSWWNCPGAGYDDIRRALLGGCGYAMRIPDYGDGDWSVKYEANACLPQITDIGLHGTDTVHLALSREASRIVARGQGGAVVGCAEGSDSFVYAFRPEDTYVRLVAEFDDGVVIYSNPFARYDSSLARSPYRESGHRVNVALTILFNLAVLALVLLCWKGFARLVPHKERKA